MRNVIFDHLDDLITFSYLLLRGTDGSVTNSNDGIRYPHYNYFLLIGLCVFHWNDFTNYYYFLIHVSLKCTIMWHAIYDELIIPWVNYKQ